MKGPLQREGGDHQEHEAEGDRVPVQRVGIGGEPGAPGGSRLTRMIRLYHGGHLDRTSGFAVGHS